MPLELADKQARPFDYYWENNSIKIEHYKRNQISFLFHSFFFPIRKLSVFINHWTAKNL